MFIQIVAHRLLFFHLLVLQAVVTRKGNTLCTRWRLHIRTKKYPAPQSQAIIYHFTLFLTPITSRWTLRLNQESFKYIPTVCAIVHKHQQWKTLTTMTQCKGRIAVTGGSYPATTRVNVPWPAVLWILIQSKHFRPIWILIYNTPDPGSHIHAYLQNRPKNFTWWYTDPQIRFSKKLP